MSLLETMLSLAVFGLASAVHCAGMCGPLALRGCSRSCAISPRLTLEYVAGRAAAYVFLGTLAGSVGAQVLARLGSPIRVIVAEAVALMLLVEGLRLLPVGRRWARSRRAAVAAVRPTVAAREADSAKSRLARALRSAALWIPREGLGLGLATGFLPCGALVSALVLASSSGSALAAAAGMLAFSFASLPGVLGPLLLARPVLRLAPAAGDPRMVAYAGGTILILLALWVGARPLRIARHSDCHVHAASAYDSGPSHIDSAHVVAPRPSGGNEIP